MDIHKKQEKDKRFDFVIGQDVSLEDMEKFAEISQNPPTFPQKFLNLTKYELLFCKYCYTILDAANFILRYDGKSISDEDQDIKRARIETIMYAINMEAMSFYDPSIPVIAFNGKGAYEELIGENFPYVIEFALLQAGFMLEAVGEEAKEPYTSRRIFKQCHKIVPCEPIRMKDIVESINAKLMVAEEIEAEQRMSS